ncbi:hypothetical protein A1O7_03920 [Cladophialophora yegresii CBS 114405]|uniref:Transcription factor domain-containing protein n=1 Tax=Cladophialophora yegresii CBS 114405 TaxID=1182544 RepID=W9VVS6_9EURO|nr:uncharacterized protein A1O7_03920 [Cladophialophora yegresii CBS 114405]EXJ59773.1 hypothetical protein A1O7_03920 [Cladophialophora yegresii CBS 114405]
MDDVQRVPTSTLQITELYHKLVVKTDNPGLTPRRRARCSGCSADPANFEQPKAVMTDQDPSGQPPDQRPPAYNGPFLFVNKNASNLRSRQREEVFAVRSHAMQIARRSRKPSAQSHLQSIEREKQAQADAQSPEASPAPGAAGSPAAEPIPSIQDILEQQAMGVRQYQQSRQSSQPRQHPLGRRTPGSNPPLSMPAGTTFALGRMYSLLPADHAASLGQTPISASTASMSPGGLGSSGDLPSDTFFNSVLQFWRLNYMSNFWPAHVYLNPSHQAVQCTDSWIRNMVINNPAMMHGLFSGALSYITNYLPPTENTPMLWARAIHHYGKCLEETREQLSRPGIGTEQALSLIHGMTTFSFHCQDLESCQVHRTASMRLLQNLDGGLESVHPVLKCLMILCESLIASHVPIRPAMDIGAWAPKPWAQENSLRSFDGIFTFDARSSRQTDIAVFLLSSDDQVTDHSEDILELINWHREALAANELGFRLAHSSEAASPEIVGSGVGDWQDQDNPIYAWLSLRHHALSCLSSNMFVDLLEVEDQDQSLPSQLHRAYHACVLLASSYLTQFVLRRDTDAPSMAYVPVHHFRTQLELLLTLMSQFRRSSATRAGPNTTERGPSNPIPTDGLLFLFFAGALFEESDGPSRVRAAHHIARAGVIASPVTEHPVDLINERWFSVHFAMVLQRLDLDSWQDAQRVLKRFVYADRVLDTLLEVLVARKLEFLAALVARVPSDIPAGEAGFFGAQKSPNLARQGATSPFRPPVVSHQSPLQVPAHHGLHLQGSSMSMPLSLPGVVPSVDPDEASDTVPMFGPMHLSHSGGVPLATAYWWEDTGYGLEDEEDAFMDLEMHPNFEPGLNTLSNVQMSGEDVSDLEEPYDRCGVERG